MKKIKLFNKILLSIGIIFIILTSILFILGRINREGYLSKLSIKVDDTLQLNNIDIETTKEMFSSDDKLDYSLLTNYIFTNSNISKYSYDFRISYYSKVFKNSDIYGVYLNTNSLPDYVYDVQFKEKGSPFGILVSSEIIKQEKIDSIQYFLQIKYHLFVIIIMSIYLSIILLYKFGFIIIDFIKIIYNIKLLKNINLKNKYLYILVIFLCFLIIPNIIYILFGRYFDKTNYENRLKAQKPILSITNLVNYPLQYEKYFNDHISFRNELIQLKNIIDLFIFKNIISTKALLGKEKWLFLKSNGNNDIPDNTIGNYIGIERYSFSNEELEKAKNILLHFKYELKKRNIDFIFMICPDKEFIYTNYMPNYIKRKTIITSTDKFVEFIRKNTDIKIIYPKDELIKYKDKYQLYYPYEHHFNALGGYITYAELMKSLDVKVRNLENLNILSFNFQYRNSYSFYSQTASYIALSRLKYFKDTPIFVISNFINPNTNIMIDNIVNWSIDYYYTNIYTNEFDLNNNIYIIRDSMVQELLDYIFPTFRETTVIADSKLNKFDIIKQNPDIVIYETLERFLKYKIFEVIPNYKIEEINKDLETNYIKSNN